MFSALDFLPSFDRSKGDDGLLPIDGQNGFPGEPGAMGPRGIPGVPGCNGSKVSSKANSFVSFSPRRSMFFR